MPLGATVWATEFGIGTEAQFISECSPWWPESAGWWLRIDREQMLKIAYAGGENNPLAQIAYVGLMAEKKLGSLETATRDVTRAATSNLLEGSRFMAPLVVPEVGRVAIMGRAGTQQVVNVIGVRLPAGRTISQALASVKAAWEATPGPCSQLSAQYKVEAYVGTDLSSLQGEVAQLTSTKVGVVTGDAATAGACFLIKAKGNTRSRSGNGRMYLGPISETAVSADGRTITSGFMSGVAADMEGFRSKLATDGNAWCVISQVLATATTVTAINVDPLVATQRRRIR
jgi:hypothetical protein